MGVSSEQFYRELEASNDAVLCIAVWLQSKGCNVRRPEGYDEPGPDNGDLYIGDQRIEVKQRIRPDLQSFTSEQDYPYPSVMVCEDYRWDKAKPTPYWVFNVNGDLTHAVLTPDYLAPTWTLSEKREDRRYGDQRRYYLAPFKACTFYDIRVA